MIENALLNLNKLTQFKINLFIENSTTKSLNYTGVQYVLFGSELLFLSHLPPNPG